jgi:hypothetical protein
MRKDALCRSVALFWAHKLLIEGVLAAPRRLFVEASEEYILEGKMFKPTNELWEVVLENYGK